MGCQLHTMPTLPSVNINAGDRTSAQPSKQFTRLQEDEEEETADVPIYNDSSIHVPLSQKCTLGFMEPRVEYATHEQEVAGAHEAFRKIKLEEASNRAPKAVDAAEDGDSTAVSTETGNSRRSVTSLDPPDALLIFDWDDTLFPTSWVQRNSLMMEQPSPEQLLLLDKLTTAVQTTLTLALRLGHVVIVTNADEGWLEWSSGRLLPKLDGLLEHIEVTSARTLFETEEDKCPFEWKRLAFKREVDQVYDMCDSLQHKNILSIGDSMHEHSALISIAKGVPNCSGKTIRFSHCPSIVRLIDQHNRLHTRLGQAVSHPSRMNLEL